MINWFSKDPKRSNNEYNPDNVKIDKDGIVSLNTDSEDVRKKIQDKITKLKMYEDRLVSH